MQSKRICTNPKPLTSQKNIFATILLFIYVLGVFFLLMSYTGGDQEYYRALYSDLRNADLTDILALSHIHLHSYEPLSPLILWLGASAGVDKDVYISFLNLVLIFLTVYFCRENKTTWTLIFLLLTNYYFLVLLTGAERLKISYIFLALFAISNSRWRYLFLYLAVLSHFQNIILLIAGIIYLLIKNTLHTNIKINLKAWIGFLLVFVFGWVFMYFLSDGLFFKFYGYMADFEFNLMEFFQISILLVITYCVTRDKKLFIALGIVFLPLIALLGGSRLNMIAFTMTIYIITKMGMQNSRFILLLMLYLSFKSIPFIFNVLENGTGFY